MYILNIVSPTKEADIYDEVSLNAYPIIWSDDLEDLYIDETFKKSLISIVKKESIYEKCKICWRLLDDDGELVSEGEDKLPEKIKLELK